MYNAKYVIPGLVIFLLLVLSPILYDQDATPAQLPTTAAVKHPYPPDLTPPMDTWKANHMKSVNSDSIANCKGCHANTATFCDKCHDYVGVKPAILAK